LLGASFVALISATMVGMFMS
jgi:hypothetical protein